MTGPDPRPAPHDSEDDPARDAAGLRRWLDGRIAEEEDGANRCAQAWDFSAAARRDIRATALREVRERLGATTHTTPEGGTDDH